MIRQTLANLGLNQKEIALYLALLPMGAAPASVLGARVNITRSTAQYTCQQLVKKGLLNAVQKQNMLLYSPESPDKILFLLDQQRAELQEKESQAQRIIGDLRKMINPQAALPKVKFYEGRDGVIQAYRALYQSLRPGSELLTLARVIDESTDAIDFGPVMLELEAERARRGILLRMLAVDTPAARAFQKEDANNVRLTRLLSPELVSLAPTEIDIAGDCLFTISVAPHASFCYEVANHEAAALHRASFELAWRAADQAASGRAAVVGRRSGSKTT